MKTQKDKFANSDTVTFNGSWSKPQHTPTPDNEANMKTQTAAKPQHSVARCIVDVFDVIHAIGDFMNHNTPVHPNSLIGDADISCVDRINSAEADIRAHGDYILRAVNSHGLLLEVARQAIADMGDCSCSDYKCLFCLAQEALQSARGEK